MSKREDYPKLYVNRYNEFLYIRYPDGLVECYGNASKEWWVSAWTDSPLDKVWCLSFEFIGEIK